MAIVDDLINPRGAQRTCVVVLGGRSFLGRSLVTRLLQLGDWIVRVADSTPSLQLDADSNHGDSVLREALASGLASYCQVDVRDLSQIIEAVEGSSVVFYMEATDLPKHDFYDCYMIIVQGAKNVINACRECKVRQLIYNSSADVIFDGSHDIFNRDESFPCHWKSADMLSDLKAQAEALVLYANNIGGLLTCALRPSNVFGPGDTQLVPFLVNLARSGWAKLIIGSGDNMSDFTYAENVTHAHICAAKSLDSQMISVAGKAFFITNLEPMKFQDFVSLILEGLGYQRPSIKVPARIVSYVLLVVEWMCEKLGSRKYNHDISARFFHLASCTRTFNCSAAQKYIGYSPVVSLEDGIRLTIESFSHLAKDSSFGRFLNFEDQSKAEKLLGSGKVSDILLWRDEKKTFTCFVALVLLFYWFLLSGKTFASSTANLLLLVTTILYGYANLPPKISSFNTPKISLSSFEISENSVRDSIMSIVCLWNRGHLTIRSLAQGEDWNKFFQVVLFLYFVKWILVESLAVAIGLALVFTFTAFFVYEQYESEIDGLTAMLFSLTKGLLTSYVPASMASFLQNKGVLRKENGKVVNDE
ncbi:3beta-hydroxysteroid-dehydrogenase/decarboxylase isoform X1 [Populus alba x Populus x berolinensis]|uniref:Reticulon-like protein n=1 Tax=Populus alba x Populus x berolinensis TaxID=444605 RepID=A0AAD6QJB9_9ROSI|nr:3beta-hydroxysteroid-dehydrogenase/decarboxylase isoform X1 [Populus alba x Populus x berolinensis]KAJ6991457.1 3beta-hydroxysteroid-dehydrogenase/decarboxylase isoform X1 [Populus alba x Populus x berolinensis]